MFQATTNHAYLRSQALTPVEVAAETATSVGCANPAGGAVWLVTAVCMAERRVLS